jgi:GT2 family glycosyltransferase
LRSILKYSTLSYEVIIVDDASNDTTGELLKKVKNIKVIRNESNLGFIGSCNEGMKVSDGKYVLFLNNDTLVTEYWLEPLVNVIDRKNVGAVGAKLIYPNGKLQEAGGIIWNDASGWNYGRGDDAEMPEYNFIREVDYCSGAALMVKKELFDKLGGFNSIFKPAYYEDTDLCFALRGIKYKVMYQPQSVVVHFEGASNGIDTSSSVKRYQEVNKTKFEEKWHNVLLIDQYPPDSTNLFLARNKKKGMNILVIDHYIPTYDKDSGSLRMYNMLKILSELGHKVTFIGNNLTKLEPYTSVLQQNGVEVIYDPYCRSIDEYLAINGRFFNIAILSRAHVADKYILSVKKYCTNAKIIFDTVDLQFLREERRAKVENEKIFLDEAKRLKEIEFRLMEMSDVTLVVSPVEKEIINNGNPQIWVEIISNILEVKGANTPFSDRKDIMFVGNFIHPPNADAVKWFVKEIFPLVKEKLPGVKFYITGDNPTGEIMALASQDVVVTGFVKDLTIYFEKCRVFVAPLRYGAGVKGKINQSMSYGLPVISTTIGIEGMQLKDGVDILVADTPGEFVDNIVRLYLDEELWNKISSNSIINVQNNFSYDTGKQKIKELINHLTTNDATIIIKNDSAIH